MLKNSVQSKNNMNEDKIFDCIIIGAGPGGLQASIYLGRYNRDVLILDRGGGRTRHAQHIENFLTHKIISGNKIIDYGMEQAKSFNVKIEKSYVKKVHKNTYLEIYSEDRKYFAKFIIASSGVYDNLPSIVNVHKFLGTSFFTCVDCDGYRTTGKKLVIIGNSIQTVHLAFAMKEMFTEDITLILYYYIAPDDYLEELKEQNINLIKGFPVKIIGDEKIEAIELKNGKTIPCEVIMSNFGYKLNDKYLSELQLKKDGRGKYITDHRYESSMSGLYIVGPLNTGNDQAIIAAGEGAIAAIDINKRLLAL